MKHIIDNIEEGKTVMGIFMELSKAFVCYKYQLSLYLTTYIVL